MTRKYSSRLKSNHSTVRIEGNLLGCWNGLTSSAWLENNQGRIIWEYSHDPEVDGETGEQYFPLFAKSDWTKLGFILVEDERADVCQFPDNW